MERIIQFMQTLKGVAMAEDYDDDELSSLEDLYGYEDEEDNLEAAYDDVLKHMEQ